MTGFYLVKKEANHTGGLILLSCVYFRLYLCHFCKMNYPETLQYLYANLPMFSRLGAGAYKKDLTNTILLCNSIGNPQNQLKTIHVAGTNGKGSVSHMLAGIFQQCGYKTGLYTSPHLKDFRERIKINGAMIPEEFIVSFVAKIKETSEAIHPSFFELTVAMMLALFADQKTDIAIIETGLGGRLDSTNIINPELSIITNIGFDHMNILGNTLKDIAFEKAGIIKKNTPAVIGETLPDTQPVFLSAARACNAEISFAEEEFEFTNTELQIDKLVVGLKNCRTQQPHSYTMDLNGIYQKYNLRTVVTAVDILRNAGYHLDNKNVDVALRNVKNLNGLYGRWDVVQKDPLMVLDVAHNEDGIKQLLTQLSLVNFKYLHIVFGLVKDKEISSILALLPKKASYYFTKAQIPRALPEDELVIQAHAHHLKGAAYPDVNMALHDAKKNAGTQDMILICGSVYLVGEVYQALKN